MERLQSSKQSFNAWLDKKSTTEKATQYLKYVEPPSEIDIEGDGASPYEHWEEVGQALKAIDRTLLSAWIKWSDGFQSRGKCRTLWDSFTPISCDVHSTSSAIRDTFLKLLHRREINFRDALIHLVDDAFPRRASGLSNDEKMDKFDLLPFKHFNTMLRNEGIVMQKEEVERLIDCFDPNGEGRISMKEFFRVIGEERGIKCHGDTDEALKDVCLWETVCHECGMPNAFQLLGHDGDSNARLRAELPAHALRRQQKGFYCSPILNLREVKEDAPESCEHSTWGIVEKTKALKKLKVWSSDNRESHLAHKMITVGKEPGAPTLFRDDDEALDPTSMLLLRWDPPPIEGNNGPTFYVLESSGIGMRSNYYHKQLVTSLSHFVGTKIERFFRSLS